VKLYAINEAEGTFKDTAGDERPVHDVRLGVGNARGTFRGALSVNHANGRGWLVVPDKAPIAVTVEGAEATDKPGVALYRFMVV
jgi:hypothetical protein